MIDYPRRKKKPPPLLCLQGRRHCGLHCFAVPPGLGQRRMFPPLSSLLRPLSETNRRGLAAAPGRDDAPAPHAPSTAAHSLSGGNSRVRTVHRSAVIIHHARRKCKHSAQIIFPTAAADTRLPPPCAASPWRRLPCPRGRSRRTSGRGRSARAPSPGDGQAGG